MSQNQKNRYVSLENKCCRCGKIKQAKESVKKIIVYARREKDLWRAIAGEQECGDIRECETTVVKHRPLLMATISSSHRLKPSFDCLWKITQPWSIFSTIFLTNIDNTLLNFKPVLHFYRKISENPKGSGKELWCSRVNINLRRYFQCLFTSNSCQFVCCSDISTGVNIYSTECKPRFLSASNIHLLPPPSIMLRKVNTRWVMCQWYFSINISIFILQNNDISV